MKRAGLMWGLASALMLAGCGQAVIRPPAGPMVEAVAWAVVPTQSTAVFRQGGQIVTTCSPNLTGALCSTTEPADTVVRWPVSWLYVIVRGGGTVRLLECSARTRWSQCHAPVVGSWFAIQPDGGDVWLYGASARVKFHVVGQQVE